MHTFRVQVFQFSDVQYHSTNSDTDGFEDQYKMSLNVSNNLHNHPRCDEIGVYIFFGVQVSDLGFQIPVYDQSLLQRKPTVGFGSHVPRVSRVLQNFFSYNNLIKWFAVMTEPKYI